MKFKTVFQDDYADVPAGKIIKCGLRDQYFGKWTQSSHHYSWKSARLPKYLVSPLPWRRVKAAGKFWLEQPESWENVVVCAGDAGWRDIVFSGEFTPLGATRCGPLVRYQTSRHYYWAALEGGNRAAIYKRRDDDLILLGAAAFPYKMKNPCRFAFAAAGGCLTLELNSRPVLTLADGDYGAGQIGLRADGPARFGPVKAAMPAPEFAAFSILRDARQRRLAEKRVALPRPRQIAAIPVPVEADYIHLDDFNQDGRIEAAVIKQHCIGPNLTRIAYVGLLDERGNVLWSNGRPEENLYPVHSDVAFNFGDVDGDGRKEILLTQDRMLKIIDARTGALKNEIPTPGIEGEEHIIGDSILLADLEGCGARQNILLKDRYANIWAYDNRLNLLWHRTLNTGHYPRAADVNGDGREEVMAGYSMLAADGATMWTVPNTDPLKNNRLSEHADSIWIGRFRAEPDAPVQVAMAASDMGFMILDANSGALVCREKCGHAQSLAVAKFRPGLPGCQFAVCNLWGNPGIFTLFDCHGRRLLTGEYPPFEPIIPVNWKGNGEVFFTGANTGRMFDADLETICAWRPGGPGKISVRPVADDFTGLGVDQLAFFDGRHIRIYRPSEYGPVRMRHDVRNFNFYGAFILH